MAPKGDLFKEEFLLVETSLKIFSDLKNDSFSMRCSFFMRKENGHLKTDSWSSFINKEST